MPRAAWWVASGGLAVLSLGMRLFRLGTQELRGDEGISYLISRGSVAQIIASLLGQGVPHPPLHYVILHAWMSVAGRSEFALRTPSAVLGALLVPLMFVLGRQLRGRTLGFMLAGLAAVSQSLVWLAQDVRSQYMLAIVFSTLATILFLRALERPSWHSWAFYALACALTVYSHYYGVFALVAHGLYFPAEYWGRMAEPARRRQIGAWLAGGIVAAAAVAPWLASAGPQVIAAGQLSEPSRPELAQHLTTVGTYLAVGSAYGSSAGRWFYLLGLVLSIIGVREMLRRARGRGALLVGWLGAAALGTYLLRFSRETFSLFYIAVAAPAWWALVGLGILALWEQRQELWKAVAVLSLVALVAANGISLYHYYYDPDYSRSTGYRKLAAYLAQQTRPGDVFVANYPDPCLDYYLEAVPLPRTIQPTRAGASAEETERGLEALATQYGRLWFISSEGTVWDPKGVAYHWLDRNTLLEQEKSSGHLKLEAHRPTHALDQMLHPSGATVAGMLRLEGSWVTVKGEPARWDPPPIKVPAGAKVKVTLAWRGLAEIPEGYTAFVHLLDAQGKMLAQHDGLPAGGRQPTFSWAVGELVLDQHELAVPRELAEGEGTLVAGIYNTETLERQRFADGRDDVLVAPVRLTR